MSADWQIGDLALCVAVVHPRFSGRSILLSVGTTYTVESVGRPVEWCANERGLGLREAKPNKPNHGFPETLFRKIRPDEHQACEPEFVTLLKRTKRKVPA